MKNQVKNAPKKASKMETLKTTLINTEKGMEVKVQNNVKGKDIEKAKRQLSALQVSKIEANNAHKQYVGGFNFILDSFKINAIVHLKNLNQRHKTNFKMSQVMELKSSDLCALMSDKEKQKQAKNRNLWNFWQVETLMARYLKARYLKASK